MAETILVVEDEPALEILLPTISKRTVSLLKLLVTAVLRLNLPGV